MKRFITIVLPLLLVLSSMSLAFAEDKKITFTNISEDVNVVITNVTGQKTITFGDSEYGHDMYIATGEVKITFGDGFYTQLVKLSPNGELLPTDDENKVKASAEVNFTENVEFDVKVEADETSMEGNPAGNYVIIKKPGLYLIEYQPPALATQQTVLQVVAGEATETTAPVEEPTTEEPAAVESESLSAATTSSKVMVNGKDVAFDAYNINDNNYFKLRDIAMALNGSEKQFDIGWDGEKNLISVTTNSPYEAVGGELGLGEGLGLKEAIPTSSTIQINGEEVSLTAYNIDGNNYFKLRELGEKINFGVDWDAENKTIVVDTAKAYAK